MEGNIERGSSRKKITKEVDSEVEQSRLEKMEQEDKDVEISDPERFVKETAEELDAQETIDPEQIRKWVNQTIREITDEDETAESEKRIERWAREVIREILEDEDKEIPDSREIQENESPTKPWKIRSKDDLDASLEHYPDMKAKRDYGKLYDAAVEYYESEANEENIEPPQLVKELEYEELKRTYEKVHGGPPEVSIESMKDVDDLLEKYPSEKERKGFEELHRRCEVYFDVKDDHSMTRDELGEKHKVSHSFVGYSWNEIEPTQIKRLRGYEEDRMLREWVESDPQLDENTLRDLKEISSVEVLEKPDAIRQIEQKVVREALEPIKESKTISTQEIVSTIEHMHQNALDENHRIHYAELSSEIESKQIEQIAKHLQTNRERIEESLSQKLGLEDVRFRVAVVEDRLYSWVPKHRPGELVNAYESQFYYFKDNKEIVRVVEELQKQLKLEGSLYESKRHLNEVIRQLTAGDDGNRPIKSKPLNRGPRLEGNAIRFYLDATGQRLSDLEGRVTKVTGINGQAGIENPKFPEGRQLEVLKARLSAIIVSDCHLRKDGRILYNEQHLERIDRVQDIVRELGDITLQAKFRRGVYDIHIQNQVGIMMIKEGLTPGNKTINNPGLPGGFVNWSEEAKRSYLEELIPEDGNFSSARGFSWFRSNSIYFENPPEGYDFESKVDSGAVDLIKEKGIGSKGLIEQYELSFGEIKRLQRAESPEVYVAAQSLVRGILESPNNLIEDEKRIAESIGIEISLSPVSAKYFPKTGKISVGWAASTTTKEDAIRWAQICPPNDVRKMEEVEDWLKKIVEKWADQNAWKEW